MRRNLLASGVIYWPFFHSYAMFYFMTTFSYFKSYAECFVLVSRRNLGNVLCFGTIFTKPFECVLRRCSRPATAFHYCLDSILKWDHLDPVIYSPCRPHWSPAYLPKRCLPKLTRKRTGKHETLIDDFSLITTFLNLIPCMLLGVGHTYQNHVSCLQNNVNISHYGYVKFRRPVGALCQTKTLLHVRSGSYIKQMPLKHLSSSSKCRWNIYRTSRKRHGTLRVVHKVERSSPRVNMKRIDVRNSMRPVQFSHLSSIRGCWSSGCAATHQNPVVISNTQTIY